MRLCSLLLQICLEQIAVCVMSETAILDWYFVFPLLKSSTKNIVQKFKFEPHASNPPCCCICLHRRYREALHGTKSNNIKQLQCKWCCCWNAYLPCFCRGGTIFIGRWQKIFPPGRVVEHCIIHTIILLDAPGCSRCFRKVFTQPNTASRSHQGLVSRPGARTCLQSFDNFDFFLIPLICLVGIDGMATSLTASSTSP